MGSACGFWRQQEWLAGDPLVRLRHRPMPPDNSKALTRPQVATVLELYVPMRGAGAVDAAVRAHRPRRGGTAAERAGPGHRGPAGGGDPKGRRPPEDGASTPMLSGHTSVRSLAKYAQVSAEALGRWQAERDRAGRGAGGRR
ncbi:hypothetical protein [Microbispora sp. H10830]|uniref:hypothetical protein n=1 Tax=Microbispora sp. H10830 TaxID=2729109 RepID=UPI001C71EEB0|nr:hypothetical protein [Microbispora sp. H10830]